MNIDYKQIKLIVWDLDDTFWRGTLSEGGAEELPSSIELVHKATDCGVMNSICSKNDPEDALARLRQMGMDSLFVFTSINWEPKGQRLANLIRDMRLRPANTLFLDDNPQNLNEALHYSPDLMTAGPETVPALLAYYSGCTPKDTAHKRLGQYRIMQQKQTEQQAYSSNEAFLYDCDMHVDIHRDCLQHLDRIAELVLRSNQLNYTKLRSTKEELYQDLQNPAYESGYVTVSDRFGDYGIVGFYVTTPNGDGTRSCKHLLFSCRTIGQGVEQYVYAWLGYPRLQVNGSVITMVDRSPAPGWINRTKTSRQELGGGKSPEDVSLLFKGPCDLMALTKYIKGRCHIDQEFTYIGQKHNVIEAHNHSVSLVGLYQYTDAEKQQLISDCIFMDPDFFRSTLFTEHHDIVFLSATEEPNLGIYRKRGTRLLVPFANAYYPLTDPANWQKYIHGEVYYGLNHFTEDWLRRFAKEYEFAGKTTPEEYIGRLRDILAHLPQDTRVGIFIGSELAYEKAEESYQGREKEFKAFNTAIRQLAAESHGRLFTIDPNRYLQSQADFYDHINHYQLRIYYAMAQDIIEQINDTLHTSLLQRSSRWNMVRESINMRSRTLVRRIVPKGGPLYDFLQGVYRKIRL